MATVTKRRIILDVDVGTDDAFAIMVLLDADKRGLIKIEAIVCTTGNTEVDNVCKNVIRLLETLGRTDIPIFKGAEKPIISHRKEMLKYHGKDGLGDLEHETEPDLSLLRKEPAVFGMYEIVKKNPKEITLVILGPSTNVALAVKIYPDFKSNLKDVFIMGGNYLGIGNVNDSAEFNFWVDPEAAYTVFEEIKCPITLVPWEIYIYTSITLGWRYEVLGKHHSAFMDLLNRAEKNVYFEKHDEYPWHCCDAIATLVMLHPEIVVRQKNYNLTVELHGANTRGQVVINRDVDFDILQKDDWNINSNVVVVEKVDFDKIKELLTLCAKRLCIEN